MGRVIDTIPALSRSGERGVRGRHFRRPHFALRRRLALQARFEISRRKDAAAGHPRALGEVRKSRETLPSMNDTNLLEARSFHSRLIDLLRVEFVSLGAFLEALAEFDRRSSSAPSATPTLRVSPQGVEALPCGGSSPARRGLARPAIPPGAGADTRREAVLHHRGVLASVATEENLAAVLPRFYGLSKQEAMELAAELKPRTVVPTRTVVTRRAGPGGERTVPEIRPGELWMPRTGVEQTEPERTVVEPLTATMSRIHVTVSRAVRREAEEGQGGGVARPSRSVRRAGARRQRCDLLLAQQGKRKARVPARVKREVVKRDGGKCQWNRWPMEASAARR